METTPAVLYSYMSFEKGIKTLETGKLRLCSISEFNDPFEFMFKTDYPFFFTSLDENCTEEEIDHAVNILDGEELFVCKNIVKAKAKDYLRRKREIKVGCFSESYDNSLMWSHYARKFSGMVLGFSTAMDYWSGNFVKVTYSNEMIDHPGYQIEAIVEQKWQRDMIVRKSIIWQYEREWRLLAHTQHVRADSDGSYIEFDPKSLKSIIFGNKNCALKFSQKNITRKIDNVSMYIIEPMARQYGFQLKQL